MDVREIDEQAERIIELIRIEAARQRITNSELADRVGIDDRSLGRYFNGERDVKLRTLMRLCRELGIEFAVFDELSQDFANRPS